MKVYIQIGSTRERIEFDLKPSDNIKVVKEKIAEDRGIPIEIQGIYKNFNDWFNKQKVLTEDTKLSEIKIDNSKDSFPRHDDGTPNDKDYLRLFMLSKGFNINVRPLAGSEFVVNCDDLQFQQDANINKVKYEIFRQKGYPTRMQSLYLGDTSMSELNNQEHILSPQICSKICNHGLVLRVSGCILVRSIARGRVSEINIEIDSMDKVSKIKQKIINNQEFKNGPRNIHLYIDGNDIQNLEDDKTLCDYNIRGLLQHGLLMKPSLSTIFVKSLTGRTHELHCNLDDTTDTMKDLLEQETELAPDSIRLIFAGTQLMDGKCLSDYNIQHQSTVHFEQRLRGD